MRLVDATGQGGAHAEPVLKARQARDGLHELLQFDTKLESCGQMSNEIEQF